MTDRARRLLAPECEVDSLREHRRQSSAWLLVATGGPLVLGFLLFLLARAALRFFR